MNTDYNGFLPDESQGAPLALVEDIEKPVEEKSHYQKIMDRILDEQLIAREILSNHFLSNPGAVATLGEDFLLEFGDVEFHSAEGLRDRDRYEVTISQTLVFYRNPEDQ
jgi:hypothetical protein